MKTTAVFIAMLLLSIAIASFIGIFIGQKAVFCYGVGQLFMGLYFEVFNHVKKDDV